MDPETTTGVTPPPAAGENDKQPPSTPAGTTPPAGQTPPAAAATKTTQVPLDVVTALRDELKSTKAQANMLQGQLSLYQANQQFGPQAQAQPAAAQAAGPAPSEDPLAAIDNLSDTDVITVKDLKKIVGGLSNGPMGSTVDAATANRLAKIEVQLTDPSYEQTIRTYLPDVVNTNPGIINIIQNQPNPLMAALTYARLSPRYMAGQNQTPATPAATAPGGTTPVAVNPGANILDQIDAMIANAEKPGSPDQVSGQGAIGAADRFGSMSEADFEKEVERVLSG